MSSYFSFYFSYSCFSQVDLPEENDNEAGLEETEEQSYVVDNPSLDLEVPTIT